MRLKGNKKGQIGKTITLIPVMFLIIILLAAFLIITYYLASTKSSNIDKKPTLRFGAENYLLKEIEVNGENQTIFESILNNYAANKEIFSNEFRGALEKLMKNDKEYSNKELCLYYGIDKFNGKANSVLYDNGDGVPAYFGWIFLKKDKDGNIDNSLGISKDKIAEIKVNLQEESPATIKNVVILSYYGGCL